MQIFKTSLDVHKIVENPSQKNQLNDKIFDTPKTTLGIFLKNFTFVLDFFQKTGIIVSFMDIQEGYRCIIVSFTDIFLEWRGIIAKLKK